LAAIDDRARHLGAGDDKRPPIEREDRTKQSTDVPRVHVVGATLEEVRMIPTNPPDVDQHALDRLVQRRQVGR
jgi:hypothetical protein